MDSKELYTILRKGQEELGFFFNGDGKTTLEILDGLLTNKERYGYMSCPCRLASGDYDRDVDILCPCEYREEDVAEYGSCYCNLYVSKTYNQGEMEKMVVPERRPVEKMDY